MTRDDVLDFMLQHIVFRNSFHGYFCIGICLEDFTAVKKFSSDLLTMLDSTPACLKPEMEQRTIRDIRFDCGSIHIVYKARMLQSRSLSTMIVANNLSEDKKAEYSELMCFHNLRSGAAGFISFEDEK